MVRKKPWPAARKSDFVLASLASYIGLKRFYQALNIFIKKRKKEII